MCAAQPLSDRILIAIDGSPAAERAAETAIPIAQGLRCSIEGLFVVDTLIEQGIRADFAPELGEIPQLPLAEDLVPALEKRGDEVLRWLEGRCREAQVTAITHMMMGGVPEMTEQKSAHAQMIALGRRGMMHAAESEQLGGNFRAIAHRTKLPLLVGGGAAPAFGHLMLAYDGSERSRQALAWAPRLQRSFNSQVSTLIVEGERDRTNPGVDVLEEDLARSGLVDCRVIQRSGDAAEQILAAASELKPGLILMGGYRHGAFVEWLVGSTVDRVLRGTPLPVLIA